MASESILYSRELSGRRLISLSGDAAEQEDFLQSLVTNDVSRAGPDTLVYAALLTPAGKYLSDFLIWRTEAGDFRLDVAGELADELAKRLTMYRLRRPVVIAEEAATVTALWGADPGTGLRDPRHPDLGWRTYAPASMQTSSMQTSDGDYDLHRLTLGVPESVTDLVIDDSYILECGFEALNGVDFRKGCYVGQEIVARMHFKTDLRKGLRPVTVTGSAPPMTPLHAPDGKPAGTLHSNRDGIGLAHLRFDRATEPLVAPENPGVVVTSSQ